MRVRDRWTLTGALLLVNVCMVVAYMAEVNVPLRTLAKRHARSGEGVRRLADDPSTHLFDCTVVRTGDHPIGHGRQTFLPPPEHCVDHHTRDLDLTDEQIRRLDRFYATGEMGHPPRL